LVESGLATIRDAIATTDAVNTTGSHVTSQAPTRREAGQHDDYIEEHPAYGMIGASRVQSSGAFLFGSDFRHHGYVVVSVHGASLYRGLSSDRVHADRPTVVEVALSEAQWASFVSTMNVGNGVPATILYRDGMHLPDIEPITDRREQATMEMAQTFEDALVLMRELRDAAAAGRPSMKDIRQKLDKSIQEIEANAPFVAERFDQHVEDTIEHAKIEVDAFLTGAIQRAGIAALAGQPIIELAETTQSSLPSADVVEEDGDEAGTVTR